MFGAFRLNTLAAAMAQSNNITATGGDLTFITQISGTTYKVHKFITTGNNNFVVSSVTGSVPVDILLVGGGGAGGGQTTTIGSGGGGGAGALTYQTGLSVTNQTYTIAVGAGGTGVSGANGNAGTASTGLTYTANGGGPGTINSAATNGGGSGSNATTTFTSTAGTYPYKGGNSFGTATSTLRAGGGGSGAGSTGVNAASAIGGNSGLPLQNNIDGLNLYYGSGGGGAGTTQGASYSKYGVLVSASSSGSGGGGSSGNNGNSSLISQNMPYGSGGGGSAGGGASSTTGGNGSQGLAIIRYPVTGLTSPTSYTYSTSATSTTSTITWPAVQAGDIAIVINNNIGSVTTYPGVVPTGFVDITHTYAGGGGGMRSIVSYKILTGSETGSLSVMSGSTMTSIMLIYRPNTPCNGLVLSSLNQEVNTLAPTNQTLSMTSNTGPYIGIAMYGSTSTATTRGSTTASTREVTINSGASGYLYVRTFESTSSSVSFTDSTISMADFGTNALTSLVLTLI